MKKISNTSYIVIFIFILTVIGCSNIEKQQAIINPVEFLVTSEAYEDQLNDLMHEYASLEKKNDAELEVLFHNVKKKFEKDGYNDDRIRYALLLTLTKRKFSDRDKAISLLKDWPEAEHLPISFNSFRNILIMRLEEESRLREIVNQLSHQLINEKLTSEMLQKKIDDIKDMEKSLIRRNIP